MIHIYIARHKYQVCRYIFRYEPATLAKLCIFRFNVNYVCTTMLASRIRGSNKEMPNAFNYSQINLKIMTYTNSPRCLKEVHFNGRLFQWIPNSIGMLPTRGVFWYVVFKKQILRSNGVALMSDVISSHVITLHL